jgi:hypothetical protein
MWSGVQAGQARPAASFFLFSDNYGGSGLGGKGAVARAVVVMVAVVVVVEVVIVVLRVGMGNAMANERCMRGEKRIDED